MTERTQVILIGLDGFDQRLKRKTVDGTLESLESISTDGEFQVLTSTCPPWTPCAWPSFLSGRNPGHHGAFDFFTNEGYEKSLIDRGSVDASYLSEVTDESGLTPVVINYPVTHPAPELENGAVVPGYLATEGVEFSPSHLREGYEDEYGPYEIYPSYGTDDDPVNEYTRVARHRRDMARFLDGRYDWDLLAVQFQVTDSIFHDLDDCDQIRQVLENVDQYVGDIIDLADDDPHVFIASDHGMGDYDWTFYVNSWLAENGYCETTTGKQQYFRQAKDELKGDTEESGTTPLASLVSTITSKLSTVGISPRKIHRGLGMIGLDSIVESVLPEDALVAAQNQVVDHENSTAYQLLFNSLGVHLNVEGREPNGQVSPGKYDDVREELMSELSQVRDPDGKLVFDDILPKEEVYHGKHLEDAPDIVLIPRDYQYDVSGSLMDTFRRYPHMNHKPEGILISNRELDVDPEEGASIYDIAPTVAATLGIPVDSETDGEALGPFEETQERVNWDEIAGDYRKTARDDTGPTGDVEDRLADLGYME